MTTIPSSSTSYTSTSTPGVPVSTPSSSSRSHSSSSSTSQPSSSNLSSTLSSTSSPTTVAPAISSSAASVPNVSTTSSSDGVSSGAAAGISVGCAIAGAIIAAIVVFFAMRRKSRRPRTPEPRYQTTSKRSSIPPSDSEKGAHSDLTVVNPRGGAVEEMLPQPSETKQIASELSKLQMLIRNHVNNFYSDQHMDLSTLGSAITPEALEDVATESPLPPASWTALLANTTTRRAMIHYTLSWSILNRIQPSTDIARTLLPVTVVGCLQAMEGLSNGKDYEYLQSRWYSLTALLLRDKYVKHPFNEYDDRNENLENTMAILEGILRPLSKEDADSARSSNLEQILKFAAGLGLVLLSQPSSWSFNWNSPKKSAVINALVVFPTLVQYADDNGHTVARPLEVGEREVAHEITLS